jgi:alpha-N-arabinofuranosidase
MLAMGVWCNVFIRQSKYVGMANIAQSVNVISPLMTTPTGLVKQTTWWVYLLFAKYMRGNTLGVHVKSATYEGRTNPVFIESTMDVSYLDVSAAVKDGWVSLAVVNLHAEKSFETQLKGLEVGKEVQVYLVTGESLDDVNTAEKTTVEIKEAKWSAKDTYTFPRHSFTMLRWREDLDC